MFVASILFIPFAREAAGWLEGCHNNRVISHFSSQTAVSFCVGLVYPGPNVCLGRVLREVWGQRLLQTPLLPGGRDIADLIHFYSIFFFIKRTFWKSAKSTW